MWSGHSHMYSWAGKLGRHGGFGPEKGWRLHHSTVAQLLTHQVKTSALTCSLEVKAVLLTHLSHKCTEVHVWASQAASWPDGDVLPSLLNPQNTLWQSCLFISALWWAELRGPLLVSCGIRIEIGFFLRKLVSFFFLFFFSPLFLLFSLLQLPQKIKSPREKWGRDLLPPSAHMEILLCPRYRNGTMPGKGLHLIERQNIPLWSTAAHGIGRKSFRVNPILSEIFRKEVPLLYVQHVQKHCALNSSEDTRSYQWAQSEIEVQLVLCILPQSGNCHRNRLVFFFF